MRKKKSSFNVDWKNFKFIINPVSWGSFAVLYLMVLCIWQYWQEELRLSFQKHNPEIANVNSNSEELISSPESKEQEFIEQIFKEQEEQLDKELASQTSSRLNYGQRSFSLINSIPYLSQPIDVNNLTTLTNTNNTQLEQENSDLFSPLNKPLNSPQVNQENNYNSSVNQGFYNNNTSNPLTGYPSTTSTTSSTTYPLTGYPSTTSIIGNTSNPITGYPSTTSTIPSTINPITGYPSTTSIIGNTSNPLTGYPSTTSIIGNTSNPLTGYPSTTSGVYTYPTWNRK